jgi:DnaJ-class molecular chaperone
MRPLVRARAATYVAGMADPYDILGVRRGDSTETIRKAYRKLAKRYHPDLNPGDTSSAERFKTINAANDLLSDPDKRGRFDRGEIDAEGNEIHRPGFGGARGPGRGAHAGEDATAGGRTWRDFAASESYGEPGGFSADDLDSLFGGAFATGPGRGRDAHYALSISFLEAARGTKRRVTLPDGRTLDVTIPAGIRDGHVLRLKGQGLGPGRRGGPAGDALVEISVAPHPYFRREGNDVVMDLPVSLKEAVLGATVEVPTIHGRVRLSIPPGSGTGTRLRLKGRGIGTGHQFVLLRPVLPQGEEPGLAEFLRGWSPAHPFDPRAELHDAEAEE